MHKAMRLTKQSTDRHKDLGPCLAWCARGMIIADSDDKVKIDEETVLFILCEHDVADRYVAVKDTSLKERLMH